MFNYVADFCNKHLLQSFDENILIEELLREGFIVHNPDGTPYRHTFNGYKSLLKMDGYISYENGSNIIFCKKKISDSVTVIRLENKRRKLITK